MCRNEPTRVLELDRRGSFGREDEIVAVVIGIIVIAYCSVKATRGHSKPFGEYISQLYAFYIENVCVFLHRPSNMISVRNDSLPQLFE